MHTIIFSRNVRVLRQSCPTAYSWCSRFRGIQRTNETTTQINENGITCTKLEKSGIAGSAKQLSAIHALDGEGEKMAVLFYLFIIRNAVV